MKNFDACVELIVKSIVDDMRINEIDWVTNWAELLDAFGSDSEMMKDDIRYDLMFAANNGEIPLCFNDDLDIEEADGSLKSYRQLTNAVRKKLFS